jgi:hypothetical protein
VDNLINLSGDMAVGIKQKTRGSLEVEEIGCWQGTVPSFAFVKGSGKIEKILLY